MALSMTNVVSKVRELVAGVTGIERVYAPSETDENAFPEQLIETPAVLVLPGPTTAYILSSGQHRHTYEVRVQVLAGEGLLGDRMHAVMPMVDRIIELFMGQVGLGGVANSCVFTRQQGLVGLDYGNFSYTGYEITLLVSEQATATPAYGS